MVGDFDESAPTRGELTDTLPPTPVPPVTAEDVAWLVLMRDWAQSCVDDLADAPAKAALYARERDQYARILAALTTPPALSREQEDAVIRRRIEAGRERLTSEWGYWPEHIIAALAVAPETNPENTNG